MKGRINMNKESVICKAICIFFVTIMAVNISGCVNQHPDKEMSRLSGDTLEDEAGSSSIAEVKAQEEMNSSENLRVAVTSVAITEICDRMGIEPVAVPESQISDVVSTHPDAVTIGSPMSPDVETLRQIAPDYVLSPASLISDLKPKYEAAGLPYAFFNLKSVTGMYKSIQEFGTLIGKEDKANELIAEFENFYNEYSKKHEGKAGPRVLILMGLPGSYVVATENSYAGSLVELAGGVNVYAGTDKEFLNVNAEDMLLQNPDIILRTAHAMPDSVMEMFKEEFETNDIWSHFDAVKNGKVYDLPSEYFGMSATFDYPEALNILDDLLY